MNSWEFEYGMNVRVTDETSEMFDRIGVVDDDGEEIGDFYVHFVGDHGEQLCVELHHSQFEPVEVPG